MIWEISKFDSLMMEENSRFAVITGGEPTKNAQLMDVVSLLKSRGFEIALESNGNYPIPKVFDWVTVSPKRFAKIPYFVDPLAWLNADEFKYVVDEGFDWSILDRHYLNDCGLYSE